TLTIFTLCAITDSESSLVTDRRILRVSSMSLLEFDCWPAVIAPEARSLTLTPELSRASCAIARGPAPNYAEHSNSLNRVLLTLVTSCFLFSKQMTDHKPDAKD